jgi:hypothetical protein
VTEAEWLAGTDPELLLGELHGASGRKLRLFACACARGVWGLLPAELGRRVVEVAVRFAEGRATAEELMAVRDAPWGSRPRGVSLTAWSAARAAATATSSPAAWSAAANACRAAARLGAEQAASGAAAGALPDDLSSYDMPGDPAAAESPGGTALAAPPRPGARRRLPRELAANPAWQAAWVGGRDAAEARHADLLREVFGNPFRPARVAPEWLRWRDGAAAKVARAVYAEGRFDDLPVLADALEDAGCTDAEILGHLRGPGPHTRGCWALDLVLGKG